MPRAASLSAAALAAASAALLASSVPVPDPEAYANTLTGTLSRYDLSRGNILPSVLRPWGANAWAPQTDNDGTYSSWWFHPTDARFFGVRCTKQPSPWISDYGAFRIAASLTDPGHSDSWQYSSYDPRDSSWLPYYFNASLQAYGNGLGEFTTVEVTSTNHAAVIRVRFPSDVSGEPNSGFNQTRRILLSTYGSFGDAASVAGTGIVGQSTSNSGGVTGNFAHYFNLTVFGGENGDVDVSSAIVGTGTGQNNGAYAFIDFDPSAASTDVLILRVATSFISADQASLNLATDVGAKSFDDVVAEAQAEWNKLFSRVTVVDVGEQWYSEAEKAAFLTTFYSLLYRTSQFPRFLDEETPQGTMHYSAYDPNGKVWPGVAVADVGFWDAYRTSATWASLWTPDVLGRQVNGWTNAYVEGGWLPKWSSPGYRGSMVGTMGDVYIADAIIKGIPGFNATLAYEAIRKDAFVVPTNNIGQGRTCLTPYLQNGYVPHGAQGTSGTCSEVLSRSLNYMLSDAAIASAATFLGYTEDAAILSARAANYSVLFDASTGFIRSRDSATGKFTEPFDQYAWGGDYTEAGPHQYRYYVPYDPKGLAALYASAGLDMCDQIEQDQVGPSTLHIGAYGSQIHEQTEMATLCWGQYEHNNQPVHHMLWMLMGADNSTQGRCASRAQYWTRQVTSLLYRPDAAAFVGDEDNGQLSSFGLLAMIGLYPLFPGTQDLQLGSPLFTHVSIALLNNKTLDITASNNCPTCYYVTGVTWNGAAVTGTTVKYSDLMQGGTLAFAMSDTPPSGVRGGPNPRGEKLARDMHEARQNWHAGRKTVPYTVSERVDAAAGSV